MRGTILMPYWVVFALMTIFVLLCASVIEIGDVQPGTTGMYVKLLVRGTDNRDYNMTASELAVEPVLSQVVEGCVYAFSGFRVSAFTNTNGAIVKSIKLALGCKIMCVLVGF